MFGEAAKETGEMVYGDREWGDFDLKKIGKIGAREAVQGFVGAVVGSKLTGLLKGRAGFLMAKMGIPAITNDAVRIGGDLITNWLVGEGSVPFAVAAGLLVDRLEGNPTSIKGWGDFFSLTWDNMEGSAAYNGFVASLGAAVEVANVPDAPIGTSPGTAGGTSGPAASPAETLSPTQTAGGSAVDVAPGLTATESRTSGGLFGRGDGSALGGAELPQEVGSTKAVEGGAAPASTQQTAKPVAASAASGSQGHHPDEVASYAAYAHVDSIAAARLAQGAAKAADIMGPQSAVGIVPGSAATRARELARDSASAARKAGAAADEAHEWVGVARAAEQAGDSRRAQMALNVAMRRAVTAREQAAAATTLALQAKIVAVNPFGATDNCGYVLGAVDDALAGFTSAYGDPKGVRSGSDLEMQMGGQWEPSTEPDILVDLANRGEGASAAVFVRWELPDGSWTRVGHFFNVVRQNGEVFFVNGQTGEVAQSITDLFPNHKAVDVHYMKVGSLSP
jgi:hypothetical protein